MTDRSVVAYPAILHFSESHHYIREVSPANTTAYDRATVRRDITTTMMAIGKDDDDDGDSATGDEVNDDGDGATRDDNDDDDDGDDNNDCEGWRVLGGSSLNNTVEVFTNKKTLLR